MGFLEEHSRLMEVEGCCYLEGPAGRALWPEGRKKDENTCREKSVIWLRHQGLLVVVKTSDFTVSEEAVHR